MIDILFNPYNYPFWIVVGGILFGTAAVIYRPFSTYIKFVYPNAKFEAIGNRYIHLKELEKLSENKKLDDFKESVNSSKDYNLKGDTILEVHKSLDNHFFETITMMKKDSSKKMDDFFNIFLKKHDIYLLKRVLKLKLQDREIDKEILDQVLTNDIRSLISEIIEKEKKDISDILIGYGFDDEIIDLLSEEPIDFLILDMRIDKYFIESFKKIKVPYKCEPGKNKFVNHYTDLINIKNLLRAKQLGYDPDYCKKIFVGEGQQIPRWKFDELCETESVSQLITGLEGVSYYDILKENIEEYNRAGSVQILTNKAEVKFLDHVKNISMKNFVTIGPTIRFLISKEYEIINLKIVSKAISEKLSSDVYKSYLLTEAAS